MSWWCLTLQVWGTVAAAVVMWRAFGVLHALNPRQRREHYGHFLLFGLGYVALFLASFGSLIELWRDQVPVGSLTWLTGSAFLILFDRRRRRPVEA